MKYELKDVLKALEQAKKDGALAVRVDRSSTSAKLLVTYEGVDGPVTISIAECDSNLWNEISRTQRF